MARKEKLFVFTPQILKNLVSRPVTEAYPFEEAHYTDRMRGHIEIDIEQCISCTLCAQNCPPRAIKVDRGKGTWEINRFDCVQCGNCVQVCPKKCLHMKKGYTQPETQKSAEVYTRPIQKKKFPKALSDCVYCTLCAKKCPRDAITVDRSQKLWSLNQDLCVSCGLCAKNCPKKCIEMIEINDEEAV